MTYTRPDGQVRRVLAWGALDAVVPDPSVPQQRFELDYDGRLGQVPQGSATGARSRTCAGRTPGPRSRTASRRAPRLTAPTGRSRAGSGSSRCAASPASGPCTWRGSCTSRTGRRRSPCSRSRRTGRTAAPSRACSDGCCTGEGPCTARRHRRGTPGPRTRATSTSTRSTPSTAPGWKRDGAKVTHVGSGGFCYSFAPLAAPPAGYPAVPTVSGKGERHRVTVMGPGVTPDVQWEARRSAHTTPAPTQPSTRSSTRCSETTPRAAASADPRASLARR